MPLYRFVCGVCDNAVEVLQAFKDPSPHCGACALDRGTSTEMKRTICATNFSLKGDGWAKDNYGLKNGKGN
tara:strand:+ start:895 stop:1107 length:213 start_codon:yes stop_codon:yes gene_type:complete